MDRMEKQGTCYCCGSQFTAAEMKKHLQKEHAGNDMEQECMLVKAEGRYHPEYWIYLDLPLTASLASLDKFLRSIWLECCGHLSAFYHGRYNEIAKGHKIGEFRSQTKLSYEYDFGSTTELVITMVSHTSRPKQ